MSWVKRAGVKYESESLMTTQLMIMNNFFHPPRFYLFCVIFFLLMTFGKLFEYFLLSIFNKARGSDCFSIVKWKIPGWWIDSRSSCLTRYVQTISFFESFQWNNNAILQLILRLKYMVTPVMVLPIKFINAEWKAYRWNLKVFE